MQRILRENLTEIRRRIAQAARKANRRADKIKLVAISETQQ
jgi:uncharacterized pyridoxal phosphate-containing UPF0001 family protein